MGKAIKKAAKRGTSRDERAEGASRVRKHRAKMKAMGLKPVTLWLPDTSTPEYKAQVRRECELINASKDSQIVLDGMWELTDFSDWKA
jgi:hypothetical protein